MGAELKELADEVGEGALDLSEIDWELYPEWGYHAALRFLFERIHVAEDGSLSDERGLLGRSQSPQRVP